MLDRAPSSHVRGRICCPLRCVTHSGSYKLPQQVAIARELETEGELVSETKTEESTPMGACVPHLISFNPTPCRQVKSMASSSPFYQQDLWAPAGGTCPGHMETVA